MTQIGPYQLGKRIGRGGMAEVMLAHDASGRQVVVKRMLPHLAAEATYVKLFLREARIAARLRHENVVQLLDADRDGDDLYLVFEHVDGVTLHELARRAWHNDRPLPVEMCMLAIADAAIGLHHAHELKDEGGAPSELVHRDVSPDNLMIDSTGTTRVLDFGIAKTAANATNVTRTGELRGKLAFMSPEQAQGHEVDRRSDLFSLGVTLFWLLTAQKPFSGRTDIMTLRALLEQDAPRPSSLNPRVPAVLDPIVTRLLAKDRGERFESGKELHDALMRLLPSPAELRPLFGAFVVEVLSLREAADGTVVVAMPTVPSDCVLLVEMAPVGAQPVEATQVVGIHRRATQPLPTRRKKKRRPSALILVAAGMTLSLAAATAVVVAIGPGRLADTRAREAAAARQSLAALEALDARVPAVDAAVAAVAASPREDAAAREGARSATRTSEDAPAREGAPIATRTSEDARAREGAPTRTSEDASVREGAPIAREDAPREGTPPLEDAPAPEGAPTAGATPEDPHERDAVVEGTDKFEAGTTLRRVQLVAPSRFTWRLGKRALAVKGGSASVPASTKKLTAVDGKRGSTHEVDVKDGRADVGALPSGTLRIWLPPAGGEVFLGSERVGDAPLPMLTLPVGRYRVRAVSEGRVDERTVDVTAGDNPPLKLLK